MTLWLGYTHLHILVINENLKSSYRFLAGSGWLINIHGAPLNCDTIVKRLSSALYAAGKCEYKAFGYAEER